MIAPDAHAAVVGALEANQWELFRAVSTRGGAELHEDDEVLWVVTGVPAASFNGVLRTSVAPGLADDTIARVGGILGGRTPWAWYVGPSSWPLDLPARLEEHGFALADVLPGMAAPLEDVPALPGSLRFEQVRETPSLEAFGTLLGLSFELPADVVEPLLRLLDAAGRRDDELVRNYVAFEDGTPVATGTLVIAAGVAGLFNIGVPPEHQGRGVGRAMTAALMAEGRASGALTAVLTATAAGLQCYRGLGFEERCRLRLYEPRSG